MVEDTPTDNYFYINVIGQIESCWFPVGCQSSKLYCRYDITAGPDWQLVSGLTAGITQCAEPAAGRFQEIVFNMPVEVMYKSTNPFGCKWRNIGRVYRTQMLNKMRIYFIGPQMTISFYGTNWWGLEISQGYARLHAPLGGGRQQQIRAPIMCARNSNIWSSIASWLTGRQPELRDPTALATHSQKSKGIHNIII